MGACDAPSGLPIHRPSPAFTDLETKPSIFETGIKVVDILAPYRRGGKIGLFGGAGVGKTVLIQELINVLAGCIAKVLIKFLHGRDRERMDVAGRIRASGLSHPGPLPQVIPEKFSHLRTTGVASTKNKNAFGHEQITFLINGSGSSYRVCIMAA